MPSNPEDPVLGALVADCCKSLVPISASTNKLDIPEALKSKIKASFARLSYEGTTPLSLVEAETGDFVESLIDEVPTLKAALRNDDGSLKVPILQAEGHRMPALSPRRRTDAPLYARKSINDPFSAIMMYDGHWLLS